MLLLFGCLCLIYSQCLRLGQWPVIVAFHLGHAQYFRHFLVILTYFIVVFPGHIHLLYCGISWQISSTLLWHYLVILTYFIVVLSYLTHLLYCGITLSYSLNLLWHYLVILTYFIVALPCHIHLLYCVITWSYSPTLLWYFLVILNYLGLHRQMFCSIPFKIKF